MKFDMKMILEYARVFEHTADMGDPTAPIKSVAGSIGRKGGQTIVNAYFTSDADIQKLLDAGMDPSPMNYPRVLDGNPEYGIGKYMKIKRIVADNIKTFSNNKGEDVTVNYGGLPTVIDFRDPENKKIWNPQEDGEIGNGTEAIVRFDLYSDGAGVRLEAIAITNLVEYESASPTSEYADVWDV